MTTESDQMHASVDSRWGELADILAAVPQGDYAPNFIDEYTCTTEGDEEHRLRLFDDRYEIDGQVYSRLASGKSEQDYQLVKLLLERVSQQLTGVDILGSDFEQDKSPSAREAAVTATRNRLIDQAATTSLINRGRTKNSSIWIGIGVEDEQATNNHESLYKADTQLLEDIFTGLGGGEVTLNEIFARGFAAEYDDEQRRFVFSVCYGALQKQYNIKLRLAAGKGEDGESRVTYSVS